MADHNLAPAGGHPAMDYPEHERTYAMFVNLAKYGTTAVVVLLIGMAFFLL
ncbi:aa3-type cytochrome c oxidase subunit IV [Alsobacter soli]|uniref:Aa3-type cytochrome c oxidase subunit IV n=1 Tax=Alsobacter soli TaxID=2109933 RepID=A0A2T1HZH5_9HYPH|nr:aa3-type cytochrome c oxidase subunit IV [Alsobacter soli]PSC06988.1 aa3-type cytochrome c oxidase subunit IV [Alsobacter soli]